SPRSPNAKAGTWPHFSITADVARREEEAEPMAEANLLQHCIRNLNSSVRHRIVKKWPVKPTSMGSMEASGDSICSEDFAERVRLNQLSLSSEMKSQYDFIICGSGSSGSVVARRLAENPEVSVLLIEAGGDDNVPSVNEPGQWFLNLGYERDWNFRAEPSSYLNGRAIPMNMGKVPGGGSSINLMAWRRGHKNGWDFFAAEAGNPAWSYTSALSISRRIEDWRGAPDPDRRG